MAIKVLVVDDSALIRQLLTEIISQQDDLLLVGTAANAFKARDMVNLHQPDVITLDIEMPGMDGLTFLSKLMRARPTPVIMISSLTEDGAEQTLTALELGAFDYITKPTLGISTGIQTYANEIVEKIRAAFKANLKNTVTGPTETSKLYSAPKDHIIAIGASTGGTEAIRCVMETMPENAPGIVITQHMPPGFTRSFAARLDSISPINVREAEDGDLLRPGYAYIAPGGYHLKLHKQKGCYIINLKKGEKVNGHVPSVDVMFNSCVLSAGSAVIGVLLTGMGKDGAAGMLNIKQSGGFTIAQNEASCVVYGMPREAVERNAVDEIVPIEKVTSALVNRLNLEK